MVALDVHEFDGEDVRRAPKLFHGENQRRGIALLQPPIRDGMQTFEIGRRCAINDAQDVQVRVRGLKSPDTAEP